MSLERVGNVHVDPEEVDAVLSGAGHGSELLLNSGDRLESSEDPDEAASLINAALALLEDPPEVEAVAEVLDQLHRLHRAARFLVERLRICQDETGEYVAVEAAAVTTSAQAVHALRELRHLLDALELPE